MSYRAIPSLLNHGLRYARCSALLASTSKGLHSHASYKSPIRAAAAAASAPVGSRWDRLKSAVKWKFSAESGIREGGIYVYESCVDKVDFRTFFTYLKIPDSFLSWFLVTELHVWMCMTRAMAELDYRTALCLQHVLVRNLWEDTHKRLGKLAYMPAKLKRESLADLHDHFNAMLLLYDEGLQGDDKALAGALWRVLLMCEGEDPVALETLVHYVRKQVNMLDKMTLDEFIKERNISWTPLLDCESKEQH
ncbi:hypothetical protein V5799_028120 [Amblyomma americanum]|uniref:Ubiquinol-cytochrome c chaperone domain-containing protein n=2 Tax=Amblyomma americanum TaxID=6943 RepID=A0AAQ4DDS3_AMBAM